MNALWLRDSCVIRNEVGAVGEMVECVHCEALASAASRLCPSCGEPFGVHFPELVSLDAENGSAAHQPESTDIQHAVPLDADGALPSIPDPIPRGRIILLYGNMALLVILLGLFIFYYLASPARAANEAVAPTVTVSVLATDIPAPASVMPTRSASPTSIGSSVGVPPIATPVPSPSATAIPIATATPIPPPPTPQIPTPIPTPTP